MSIEKVQNGIWKITLGKPEKTTPVSVMGLPPLKHQLEKLPRADRIPLPVDKLEVSLHSRGITLRLPLEEGEELYGLGLQLKSLRQTGKKKVMRPNSDPVADTGDSHAPVPFYLSSQGYGVLVDTARYASFYMGSHVYRGESQQGARQGGGNPDELYQGRSHRGSSFVAVDIPVAQGATLYLFAGPSMLAALQRYILFCGGGAMPALWGLGVWYRTYTKMNQEQVLETAQRLRKMEIPCTVLGLEPGWQSASYSCSYVFSEERFPQPEKMIHALSEMGYHINLWEHVFTHPTSPIHQQLSPFSGDMEVWGGLVPDLSLEEARKIFGGYHGKYLIDKGISGFKLDECDNSDYIQSPWSFPEFTQFPSGIDGEQMHCLLGLLYQKTILEEYRARNRRSFQQTRNSHAMAASLPFVLYSDLYDHKDFIRGIVTSSLSGLLWMPEVRQCESGEDLIRRLQTVIFSPMAQINAWMIPYEPWLQFDIEKNLRGELLEKPEKLIALCRDMANLRMQFVPYLYTAFAKYYFEGIPPFRALVLEDPEDPQLRDIADEWLMGDDIIVAPVTANESCRRVYLPKGDWYDFYTEKKVRGGTWFTVSPPLENIPLYVREGAVLPLAKPLQQVRSNTVFDITVTTYGAPSAP